MNEVQSLSQKCLNETLEAQIPPLAWDATVAIIAEHDRALKQFGTGTLLKIADQTFIVTAAHVVKNAKKSNGSLCFSNKNGKFVPASGEWFCSSDDYDVAVLEISDEVAKKLGISTFLRLHDIELGEDSGTGIYCFFGFPSLWGNICTESSPVMTVTPFQFISHAFEGSTTGLSGYQQKHHLLLAADPRDITNIDGNPQPFRAKGNFPARLPGDLGGISGCSIWKIGDRSVPIEKWSDLTPQVVAVETSVYADRKAIKGTRWFVVTTLLLKAFPNLKPAIMLFRK